MRSHKDKIAILAAVFLTAAAYFILARFGVSFGSFENRISPFWPAAGLAVAVAVKGGRRYLAGIALGAMGSAMMENPMLGATAIGLGAATSAGLGAALFHKIMQGGAWLGQQREAAAYFAVSLLAPLVTIFTSGIALIDIGLIPPDQVGQMLQTWWIGDAIGIMAAAPALLALLSWSATTPLFTKKNLIRVGTLAVSIVAVMSGIFLDGNGAVLAFCMFFLLVVAHAILGENAVKITTLVLVSASVIAVKVGGYQIAEGSFSESVLFIETFFGLFCLSALLIASFERRQLLSWPVFVLFGGWAMSGWVFTTFQAKQQTFERYRLQGLIDDRQDALNNRMQTYIDALRGGASLLSVKGSITKMDWRRYTETLRLFDLYPGVHGAGVVYPMRPGEEEAFRRDHPGVNVHPVKGCARPPPDDAGYAHFVISLVEPLAPNAAAIGLDLASELHRQQAAMQSRDTGEARVTRQIQLVQDKKLRPGFLLYLPVYTNGSQAGTIAERRAAFQCWIYAPFIFEEFIHNVLSAKKQEIDYFIFDGATAQPDALIYASTGAPASRIPATFTRVNQIEMARQIYTIGWLINPETRNYAYLPAMLAAGSLALASTLLAGLIFNLQGCTRKTEALIEVRTNELQTANQSLQATHEILRAREAESQKLALIVSQTANSIMLTDPAGCTTWVNDGFVRMTGYTFEEVKGREPGLFLQGPQTDPKTTQYIHNELLNHRGFVAEILNYTKDQTPFWVQIEVQPIHDENGRLINFMGIHTDITELKMAYKEADEARRMAEQANRAKSAFLGNISHELRTPLNVIIGNLHMLLQGMHGPLPAAQTKAMERAKENSTHLLDLINDLLDTAKAESGKLDLEFSSVNITKLCGETIVMFTQAAVQKGIRLQATYAHSAPAIDADPLRLKQILINLLGNALKFTPTGGHITLHVAEAHTPHELTVTVIDTGCGVSPADHERIFQEFEQVKPESASPFINSGTGLGLPIARRLAEMHGGRLTVESELGAGSRFILHLPVRTTVVGVKSDTTQITTARPSKPDSFLILAVEDYAANLELLCGYLELNGYRVAQATNGLDAITQATTLRPHLILMDVKMPGLDGLEATRRLKVDPRTKDIPVIMLTAFASATDVETCMAAGASDYFSKPVDFPKLDTLIAKYCGGQPS